MLLYSKYFSLKGKECVFKNRSNKFSQGQFIKKWPERKWILSTKASKKEGQISNLLSQKLEFRDRAKRYPIFVTYTSWCKNLGISSLSEHLYEHQELNHYSNLEYPAMDSSLFRPWNIHKNGGKFVRNFLSSKNRKLRLGVGCTLGIDSSVLIDCM